MTIIISSLIGIEIGLIIILIKILTGKPADYYINKLKIEEYNNERY